MPAVCFCLHLSVDDSGFLSSSYRWPCLLQLKVLVKYWYNIFQLSYTSSIGQSLLFPVVKLSWRHPCLVMWSDFIRRTSTNWCLVHARFTRGLLSSNRLQTVQWQPEQFRSALNEGLLDNCTPEDRQICCCHLQSGKEQPTHGNCCRHKCVSPVSKRFSLKMWTHRKCRLQRSQFSQTSRAFSGPMG
jgi:hypothetical protein